MANTTYTPDIDTDSPSSYAAHTPTHYHSTDPAVQEAAEIELDMEKEYEERSGNDLRDLQTLTIDPEGAKDFDDALSITDEGDFYRVWTHIADVAHYVDEGGAIDQEAMKRGVTFYGEEDTRHMLPEELSTDICSLVPNEERLAHTVEMWLDKEDGDVYDIEIYKSIIKSDDRLTYDEANNILDGATTDTDPIVKENLGYLADIGDTLKDERIQDPWREAEKGDHLDAEHIIEEMMVKTNIEVGKYLKDNDLPGLYRVHHSKGVKAEYSPTDQYHTGLDVPIYLHFTSPIRRYSDLVVHQILTQHHNGEEITLEKDLQEVANHVTAQQSQAEAFEERRGPVA